MDINTASKITIITTDYTGDWKEAIARCWLEWREVTHEEVK